MSSPRLSLCFGVHNHQPVGNFDAVIAEADVRSYRPFLDRLRARPDVRVTLHWTGSLLEWLEARSPATFDLLGELVARGQVELLTGGFYEPILAILPDADKLGQIARLSEYLRSHFGVRPRGMWLAERVWEPHLPRSLRESGVEYVLVDDGHFGQAGLDEEALGGYYVTEDQGATVGVFPISRRLRYLVPFADVQETVDYLAARVGRVTAVCVVDDGEKFGVWPGTYRHVYEEGWLDRFLDALLAMDELTFCAVTELGYLPRGLDVADVFTRRPEAYHAEVPASALEYDPVRRAAFVEGLVDVDGEMDAVSPWRGAGRLLGARRTASVEAADGACRIVLTPPDDGPEVDKRITVSGPRIETSYRFPASLGRSHFAVQLNLALTAGDAPGRYLTLPGRRPSLASAGRVDALGNVALVDEWVGVQVLLAWHPTAMLAWGPVETVSVSEAGLERVYQGLALLLAWASPDAGGGRDAQIELEVRAA